jgi:hypothetical protein
LNEILRIRFGTDDARSPPPQARRVTFEQFTESGFFSPSYGTDELCVCARRAFKRSRTSVGHVLGHCGRTPHSRSLFGGTLRVHPASRGSARSLPSLRSAPGVAWTRPAFDCADAPVSFLLRA